MQELGFYSSQNQIEINKTQRCLKNSYIIHSNETGQVWKHWSNIHSINNGADKKISYKIKIFSLWFKILNPILDNNILNLNFIATNIT